MYSKMKRRNRGDIERSHHMPCFLVPTYSLVRAAVGFLLLVAEPEKHEAIAKGHGLVKTDFKFSHSGSRVIFVRD